MIKTVYTVITNDYDNVHNPLKTKGWNHLLYSDGYINPLGWNMIMIPGKITTSQLLSREVKILHSEYTKADISIYIDGNFEIIGDLNEFLREANYTSGIMACTHPDRDNIRDELNAIIKLKKATVKSVNDIRLKLDHTGAKGLSETGVLIRDQSIPDYYFQKWFEMVQICPRDQASFDWVFRDKVKRFPIEIRNKYFRKHLHKNYVK